MTTTRPFDLVVHGATVVTSQRSVLADVGVRDGRIAAVGALTAEPSAQRVDAKGLHVLPGVIDTQVHFRDPGLTHKEDLSTGSAAAALGGVTSFFEMPNTQPPTTSPKALADKVARAQAVSWVDFAFYLGATHENVAQLRGWESEPGCCGVKAFLGSSTGTLLLNDPVDLELLLSTPGRRVAFHSEDEARLSARRALTAGQGVGFHPTWRDVEAAVLSTRRLLAIAQKHRARIHVLHVSTAEEIPLLAAARDVATVEVTPQHLTFAAPEVYERLGTLAQMNPPLRDARHREALWKAVADGTVDLLGSDHAPHTLDEKKKPYPESPSGMPGVQTLLPVMLTHVAQGKLSLSRLVELTSEGPARVFGIRGKGSLAIGADADFALVDLGERRVIDSKWIASRCGWTPFEGFEAHGFPVMTFVRGDCVMRDGALLGAPRGRALGF